MTLFYRSYLIVLLSLCSMQTMHAQDELRPRLAHIVSTLRQENQIHFGYAVGFSGIRETNNRYYKLYLKLRQKATNEELLLLTQDSSKCLVVYSFDILWRRQHAELKRIFLEHQNDTAQFWTAGGCTGVVDRVNLFMLRKLKPVQKQGINNYLTKEEYDFYCSTFTKEDELFTCD